jgi:23S rRNA (pseudouridine1915-N3)-methyltransferase
VRLRILVIGKLKDAALTSMCETYIERSRRFLPIEIVSCRDAGTQWSRARDDDGPNVLLDERGEQVTTLELATWFSRWRDRSMRTVDLLVGDAHGFSEADRRAADRVLALSRLTLPHRLVPLVLCEQLYRVGTVLAGHPYHHE